MKRLFTLTLLAATCASAQTPAPQPGFSPPPRQRPCLTPAEAKGLATFVLPGLVDDLAQRCRGTLARDAFLRQPASGALSQRLRRDGASSWPVAKGAIEKLSGDRLPTFLGDKLIMGFAEATAADLTLRDFDKADCGAVNDLVEGLAPLPSANFSSAIAAIISLGANSADESAPLRICTAAPLAR